jgi:Domain of unknown function (DUF4276)
LKVIVYVEGPSDRRGLEVLLEPLLLEKANEGVCIEFFPSPSGDAKASLLIKTPIKAANILLNDPATSVIVMPDLYPRDKAFAYETFQELRDGIYERFEAALRRKGASDSPIRDRFKVFCFKYELEVLLLAGEEALREQLQLPSMKVHWRIPVEDQNHERPPKRIIQPLFAQRGMEYIETYHAPLILAKCRYEEICSRCPQCFAPFVRFLTDVKP